MGLLVNILSNEPWVLNKTHFKELLKDNENQTKWNNSSELLNALLIVLFFQHLSTIINSIGIGINNETEIEEELKNLSLESMSKMKLDKISKLIKALLHIEDEVVEEEEAEEEEIKEEVIENQEVDKDYILCKDKNNSKQTINFILFCILS